ncbi:MAG: hypothetical protein RLZZ69_1267, partial [Cyanobacteriota bacterium]
SRNVADLNVSTRKLILHDYLSRLVTEYQDFVTIFSNLSQIL